MTGQSVMPVTSEFFNYGKTPGEARRGLRPRHRMAQERNSQSAVAAGGRRGSFRSFKSFMRTTRWMQALQ